MSEEEILLRLLYQALLEIRLASLETGQNKLFHVADLFHNIPLQLSTHRTDRDYSEVIDWLHMRADQKGMSGWLNQRMNDIERSNP